MYAFMTMFVLGPGMRSTAEKIADQFAPAYGSAKGFKSIMYLGDDSVGEYGSISVWESLEDLNAFRQIGGPRLEKALSGIVKGQPNLRLFEVYEPKVQ